MAQKAYKIAYGVQENDQAAANGARLIRNDKVLEAITQMKQKILMETGITLEATVKRIARLADKAEKDADKLKALDMLMKYLGGYSDKTPGGSLPPVTDQDETEHK